MAIETTRRNVLIAGAGIAAGAAGRGFLGRDASAGHLLLSACDDADGGHALAAWNVDGELRFCIPVPHRAHAVAPMPGRQKAIFFARRPGTVSYVVDLQEGRLERELTSVPGRHFYGHGVLSADGRYLYTTENDFDNARGVVGVYDVGTDYARVGELDTGGIGPHELAFLSDGRTLAVLNGGIETHPARPREKLNLDTMQSSLVYLDADSGKLLARYLPDDRLMSMRHLSVTPDDRVVIGVQYEGDADAIVPLLLSHRGEMALRAGRAGAAAWRSHRNYVASVATSDDGRVALITAPRGNTASVWNLTTHSLFRQIRTRDVAGAGFLSSSGEFWVTNGVGQVFAVPSGGDWQARRRYADKRLRWDNHLVLT